LKIKFNLLEIVLIRELVSADFVFEFHKVMRNIRKKIFINIKIEETRQLIQKYTHVHDKNSQSTSSSFYSNFIHKIKINSNFIRTLTFNLHNISQIKLLYTFGGHSEMTYLVK